VIAGRGRPRIAGLHPRQRLPVGLLGGTAHPAGQGAGVRDLPARRMRRLVKPATVL
jgi:hypothetical protein